MTPNTAELHEINDEMMEHIVNPRTIKRPYKDDDVVALKKVPSVDEVMQGFANFETWCEALGLKLHTRQMRRKAERRYKKALAKKDKR